jgi:hypothetical protein
MKGIISNGMSEQDPSAAPSPEEDPTAQAQDPSLEGEGEDENDPDFKMALQFAMSALYENGAAKNIAEAIRKAQDVPAAIANTAYEIVVITDERTDGAVDDELLMLFVTHVVNEVVDIARAAGVQVSGSDIGQAIKQMILRYLGENGVDTRELQAAMDKFDTNSLNSIEADGEAAAEAPAGEKKAAPRSEPAAATPTEDEEE